MIVRTFPPKTSWKVSPVGRNIERVVHGSWCLVDTQTASKLGLDGFELRDHSLLRRNPPDDESSVALALPTEVGETQEREGFWFSLSALFPVSRPGWIRCFPFL